MRWWLVVLVLGGVWAMASPAAAQVGYDRPGGDYLRFQIQNGDPAQCAARCDRDKRCRAWGFSFPSDRGPALCWLKREVPAPVAASCCASGVRGAGVIPPADRRIEFAIDRPGGDLRHVSVAPDPAGANCAAACERDGACRAWTYMRPGYRGPTAHCYLKNRIKPPRRAPCCISGVVR